MENESKTNTINLALAEPYCILNGQPDLHEAEMDLYRYLVSKNHIVNVLDNLFDEPEKLKSLLLLKPKTLVLGTTGVYADSLRRAIEAFKDLGYIPDNVIFTMGEEILSGLARKLKKSKPGMKFYGVVTFGPDDIEINEIGWI